MMADQKVIETLAAVAGIVVPEGDREILAGALENQLAGAAALLNIEAADVEPIVSFDPRWT
jgi:hypothetical protein